MRYILFFVIFVATSPLIGQLATSEINLNNLNTSLLEELFIEKLNRYHLEYNSLSLERDTILCQVAQDQVTYKGSQSTNQVTNGKESPTKRVAFYKGTHENISENGAAIYIKKIQPSKTQKKTTKWFSFRQKKEPPKQVKTTRRSQSKKIKSITTYEDAANAIFENWLQHVQHSSFSVADKYGIGFYLTEDSLLYVSEVFAHLPYKPYQPIVSKEIIDSDYNILKGNYEICKCINAGEGMAARSSVVLQNINGRIYIKSEKLKLLKKIFSGPNDAIYIDIVLRDQFGCDNNNLFHGSPIHDGTMLKPVLFSELFKNNQAHDGLNLFAEMIKIPDYFKNLNYAFNIGFIKNGYSCYYSITESPPVQNLSLIGLHPKWMYTKDKPFNADSISGKIELKIPFERNEITITEENKQKIERKINHFNKSIQEIKIKTYSSVEGSEEVNREIHEKRAQEIKKLLSKTVKKDVKIVFEIKENWDDFFLNIQKTPFKYLEKLKKSEIKKRLNRKSLLDSIAPILKKIRASNIEFNLKANYNFDSEPDVMLTCYELAINTENALKTATIQNRLLDYTFDKKIDEKELLSISLPYNKKFLPVWTNYLAMYLTSSEKKDYFSIRDTALKAIKNDSAFMPLQINFCLLALQHLDYYNDTIIPIRKLEKKLKQVYKMAKNKNDSSLVNHMCLNYSLLSLYHHKNLFQYDKIEKHLLNVKKHYPVAEITEEQTYGGWGKISNGEWRRYLKLAKELYNPRFNFWIDVLEFQHLRYREIKNMYCK